MVPGWPRHRQGLLFCHSIGVFYRHNRDLPDGPFQPASLLAFSWGFQKLPPSNKCPGLNPGCKSPDKLLYHSGILTACCLLNYLLEGHSAFSLVLQGSHHDVGGSAVRTIYIWNLGLCGSQECAARLDPWCTEAPGSNRQSGIFSAMHQKCAYFRGTLELQITFLYVQQLISVRQDPGVGY